MKNILVIWIDALEVCHLVFSVPESDIPMLKKFNNRLINYNLSDKVMVDYFFDDNGILKFVKECKEIESQWFDLIITTGIVK